MLILLYYNSASVYLYINVNVLIGIIIGYKKKGVILMKLKTKLLLSVIGLALLTTVFLIGSQSYFNNKEVNLASDKCYQKGGQPNVEMAFLTLNYSFSCDEK